MALAAGTRLGRYEVRALLGRGGMGEVYLAHDTELSRPVALKLLSGEGPDRRARLLREARAASALNHPGILTVHEAAEVDGVPFLATEYVDGVTLRQRLGEGPLAPAEAARVVGQVAAALAAAHRAGLVHRDIKPENVMLRRDGGMTDVDLVASGGK